jgi:endoglycosylceramidase
LKSWGFNVVRVTISWSNIEPKHGVYDENYFSNYLDNDIQWAKKYGIYVVLDMQQAHWNWKFGGGGAPDWVVAQYPPTEVGWQAAVANFWQNNTLWTSYANAWKHVASRYSNEQVVAGYDIMNEPYEMFPDYLSKYAADRWATVQAFHSFVINEIRKVDTNHIVFVEPFAMPVPPSAVALSAPNVVWEPHFYAYASHINALVYDWHSVKSSSGLPYSHENVTQLESYFKSLYDTFVLRFNQPMWIGEFGMTASVQGASIWTKDSADLFDKYNVGWAWWVYWRSSSMEENGKPSTTLKIEPYSLLDNSHNDTPQTLFTNALTQSTLKLTPTRRT